MISSNFLPLLEPHRSSFAVPKHMDQSQYAKTRFSKKTMQFWAFQRTHYWTPQHGWDPPSWKSTWRHFCRGWSDLDQISQTGAEWHVDCSDMVKIETRCRIPIWRTFGQISWHVIPEPFATLQVLPPGEFNVMIPELRVTLQGVATGRIQRHFIPQPRITSQGAATWWIHCHDSRATCHIARCSHLAKSMSWSCHIAGCNNSIRHIENRFSPYFFVFRCSLGFDKWRLSYRLRYTCLTLNNNGHIVSLKSR